DLCADRSTAYPVSCIRVRSAHGNSLHQTHSIRLTPSDSSPAQAGLFSEFQNRPFRDGHHIARSCSPANRVLAAYERIEPGGDRGGDAELGWAAVLCDVQVTGKRSADRCSRLWHVPSRYARLVRHRTE